VAVVLQVFDHYGILENVISHDPYQGIVCLSETIKTISKWNQGLEFTTCLSPLVTMPLLIFVCVNVSEPYLRKRKETQKYQGILKNKQTIICKKQEGLYHQCRGKKNIICIYCWFLPFVY
jgi:hypothetical protein